MPNGEATRVWALDVGRKFVVTRSFRNLTIDREVGDRRALFAVWAIALAAIVPVVAIAGRGLFEGGGQVHNVIASDAVAAVPTTGPPPVCEVMIELKEGATEEGVACIEEALLDGGYFSGVPDARFDATTTDAVKSFQQAEGMAADGVVGRQTGIRLGTWPVPTPSPPDPATCPDSGHGAVIDRDAQRAWLCDDGEITKVVPMTSAAAQPDPGTYAVFEKDLNAESDAGGHYSTMTHFVAFTRGKYTDARIAFHSIPKARNGEYIQPLESVGDAERYGDSAGCIRVLPDDAVTIWDWLAVGDPVIVVS